MIPPVRVLYVDDNPMDRDLVRHALEQEQGAFSLVEAATREQSEALLEETSYDVVLSDFNILGFEGLAVIDAVRAKRHRVPVIIVTGTGSEEVAIEAMKSGAADYVLKSPSHIRRLPDTIRAVLEKDRTKAALRDSEEAFRSLFESSVDAILLTAPDGRIFRANPAACKMFGMTEEEIRLVGREGLIDTANPMLPALLEQRRLTGSAFGELTFIRKDGTRFPGEVGSSLFTDSKGEQKTSMSIRDISVRKQAEESLKDSEDRYRHLVEMSPDGIAVLQDGMIVFVNPAGGKMVGAESAEQLIGKHVQEIIHPDHWEGAKRRIQQMLNGETGMYPVEDCYLKLDGTAFPVEVMASAFMYKGRQAVQIVARDITERKRTDDRLAESEERFRLAFENANIGVCMIDTQGRFLRVNDQVCETWGYSRAELENMTVNDVTHPEDRDVSSRFIERACAGEIARADFEKRYINKQGRVVWGKVSSALVRDGQGSPLYFISHVQDVTKQKKAEEAQRRLATAVEQSVESIMVLDAVGTIQYVNPAFEQISGYSRDEAIGMKPRLLKSHVHDKAFYENLTSTLKQGKAWKGRITSKRKDGKLYQEDVTISPVRDASGEIVNYVDVGHDITHQVELEKQLLQAQKMEAIGTLAGGVAHDFNNLLQVILGYTDMLLLDMKPEDRGYNELHKVHHASRRGAELVQQLLTFSRKVESKQRPVNLNLELDKVRKLLSRTIPKMIEIVVHQTDRLNSVNADPAQIEQIMMNLATNARDAMSESGRLIIETANVFLDEEYCSTRPELRPGSYVLLSVSDTGHGMDQETREHIFEPFYTTKGPGHGTGLGLAMVYGIVRQHQGCITCYSEPGKGTTFKIYLPAIETELEPDVAETKPMPRGGSETLLLVDDEEFIRDLGARILGRAGYKVIVAASGEEALETFGHHGDTVSLVILDLIMPGMGGKKCLEELLKANPAIKVIVASGFAADGATKEALATGGQGFVNKPYDIRQLLEGVREVLDAK